MGRDPPYCPRYRGQVGCGAAIEPGMDCGAAALYYGINPGSSSVSFGSAPMDVQTSWLSNPETCTRINVCRSLKSAYDTVPYESWGVADGRPVLQAWWNANDCNHACPCDTCMLDPATRGATLLDPVTRAASYEQHEEV